MRSIHIKVWSIIHKAIEFYVFCCHKCNHHAIMKPIRALDIFFKAHHFWCVTVAMRLNERPGLKDMLLNCCLKFKSARITLRVTQLRVVYLNSNPFYEVYSAFKWIAKCLTFFISKPMGIFIRLSCHNLSAEVQTNYWKLEMMLMKHYAPNLLLVKKGSYHKSHLKF